MIYTSKSNEIIKHINSLKDKKFRKMYGEFIIEGVKQVKECLNSSFNVKQIVIAQGFYDETLSFGEVETLYVSDDLFAYLSDEKNPQGILAVVETPSTSMQQPFGNSILLDRIADPGNLGTIIRTANASGYEQIYLLDTVEPYSPKCVRSAMSGLFFVNLYSGSKEEIFDCLKDTDIICADMGGENVFSFKTNNNFCLVIGNEANGVSNEIKSMAKYTVSIPMREQAESLNAAVSAGILMYNLKYKNKD